MPISSATSPADRRKPVARYVQFGDEAVQTRFIEAAENAYQRLVASDDVEGRGEILLHTTPAPARRRFFQRAPQPESRAVPTTPALARVARVVSDTFEESAPQHNVCASVRGVAHVLATVGGELVQDLLPLEPGEQAAHAAYRQTLRLAAELEGVRNIAAGVGCTNPDGCVGIRSPESWGRRVEDVEVSEVRAVLLRLAIGGRSART